MLKRQYFIILLSFSLLWYELFSEARKILIDCNITKNNIFWMQEYVSKKLLIAYECYRTFNFCFAVVYRRYVGGSSNGFNANHFNKHVRQRLFSIRVNNALYSLALPCDGSFANKNKLAIFGPRAKNG